MLDDMQLKQLYTNFQIPPDWDQEWIERYGRIIERFAGLPEAELRSPAVQEELWRAHAITTLGPGDKVDVQGAWTDPKIVEPIVALRGQVWPDDPKRRAAAIQAEFDRILALLISQRHSKRRPYARLSRLFAVLLPAEMHCVFNYAGMRDVYKVLVGEKRQEGTVAEHVLARARMRRVLGPEKTLLEHVRRSIFCWWLHERERTGEGDETGPVGTGSGETQEALALWPFSKQNKGLAAFKGLSETFKGLLRHALPGLERQELIDLIGTEPELAHLSLASRRLLVASVRATGLVREKEGLLVPTQAGEEFLATDEPDALVRELLIRYFPFAHLLRTLAGGRLPKAELIEKLQTIYPRWTSTLGPSQAIAWAVDLDLVENQEGGYGITNYGKAWHELLPQELPEPTLRERTQVEDAGDSSAEIQPGEVEGKLPDLETMLARFRADPEAGKLLFSEVQITALHNAWHCLPGKHFVILSGLSGTGKTAIVQHYARLYLEAMGLDVQQHRRLVAVAPDWRDPSGLLGYLNPLHEEPTFQIQPALELLLNASQAPHLPYFLILDEMNLASVERYFAPLLSAMETEENLVLHRAGTEVSGVPPEIAWPRRLYIAGTVNMDETTHAISDKVLDRAFTLEFWDVDLKSHFAKRASRDPEVEKVLLELHEILRRVRRHFGYRTANEVLAFTARAGAAHRRAMLDQAVFSKILPRLRGEDGQALRAAFDEAARCCRDEGLTVSADKLENMRQQLTDSGITRFWS